MRAMESSIVLAALLSVACGGCVAQPGFADKPFDAKSVAKFDEPWAMTFLPDGRLLVTEKKGKLKLVYVATGKSEDISGTPTVDYGGQGGFGDVVLHPDFAKPDSAKNGWVYLSYAEAGTDNTRGAAVARAKLVLNEEGGGKLEGLEVIWRQTPKMTGRGHYGHRIAFGSGHLWISSGERQHFDPAQDMNANLGKVLRLRDDGSVPPDNPFANQSGVKEGDVAAQVWSLGHRNPLGLAFDAKGQLWDIEMGPAGGDELNLVERGENYGYPIVSNGDHYDGKEIPDHPTRPEFHAPAVWWTPVISPGDFIFYSGSEFADWQGDALIAGLSSKALVRVEFDGTNAREVARYSMGERIREVEQGPDGSVWLLEDGPNGELLELTAKK